MTKLKKEIWWGSSNWEISKLLLGSELKKARSVGSVPDRVLDLKGEVDPNAHPNLEATTGT